LFKSVTINTKCSDPFPSRHMANFSLVAIVLVSNSGISMAENAIT
jgi:hypothetical protein